MHGIDWLVVAAGIAAIGWAHWYFFVAARRDRGPVEEAHHDA